MRKTLLAIVPVFLLAAAGCNREGPKDDPNSVARVNGEPIPKAVFERELTRELALHDTTPPSPEQLDVIRRTLLDSWVERTLLLQEAKKRGIVVSAEEVDARLKQVSADFNAEDFPKVMAEEPISAEELRERTVGLMTLEKLFQQQVYSRVAATEAEIASYFEAHKSEFELPERVRARQIVVNSKEEAARLLSEIHLGAKFEDLARKHSLSADAKVGGDLGYFARGVMPPVFEEAAFRLSPGQVSDVVASDYGFHLFQVLDKKPAEKRKLEDVRAKVEERLLESKRRNDHREFVNALRAKAQVQIQQATLANVKGQPLVAKGK